MNKTNFDHARDCVPASCLQPAEQAVHSLNHIMKRLLTQRSLFKEPLSDVLIDRIVMELACMDSNTFPGQVGVGEREGRVFSSLVAKRHYFMAHGIGRSGDVNQVQPKAAGSSLLYQLTHSLVRDAFQLAGLSKVAAASCLVVPMATGMTLSLCMRTLASKRPSQAKYVIWPRVDQKTCLKSIETAGFIPLVIPNSVHNHAIETNVDAIEAAILEKGADSIVCIMTTTSSFAPRVPDNLVAVARLCAKYSIPHLVNNAYGIQSRKLLNLISSCCRRPHSLSKEKDPPRLDIFVQSTDKNFMVPVGGAIVCGPDKQIVEAVGQMYSGRASMSPILDVFMTLLSMGSDKFISLLKEREQHFTYFKSRMCQVAKEFQLELLDTSKNEISMAISFKNYLLQKKPDADARLATQLGSMLFSRCVSGARVVPPDASKTIANITFSGYGSHVDDYPWAPYLTIAAAIGIQQHDIDIFIERFIKVLQDI